MMKNDHAIIDRRRDKNVLNLGGKQQQCVSETHFVLLFTVTQSKKAQHDLAVVATLWFPTESVNAARRSACNCVGPVLKPKVKNTAAFAMTEDSELGCEGKNLPEGPILSPRSLQIQLCS